MPVCAILTCKSDSEVVDGNPNDLKFHRFPKNEELKSKWIYMTGRESLIPDDATYVCSKHFRENDYIVKRSGSRHLKVTAIPCEYVVYRDLYPDEEPSTAAKVNENHEATPVSSPIPSTSLTPTPTLEAEAEEEEVVSTSNFDDFNVNDFNDNTIGWDQFETIRLFGQREPEPIVKRRASPAGGSTKRKKGKSKSKKHRKHRERHAALEYESIPEPQIDETQEPLEHDVPPIEDNASPADGPTKRKKGRKSRSKKHRKIRERHATLQYSFQPELEEINPPLENLNSLIDETQEPLEGNKPSMQEIVPSEEDENHSGDEYDPCTQETYDSVEEYNPSMQEYNSFMQEYNPNVQYNEDDSTVEELEPPMEEVRPPTPEVRPPNDDTEKLNQIRVLIKKHKKSRKAKSAAKEAVSMAKEIKLRLQDGALNEFEIAEAIIRIQTKLIVKLSAKHRTMRDLVTQIGALLQNVATNLLTSLASNEGGVDHEDEDPNEYLDLSF